MAKSTSKKHVHKYHKVNNIWTCALPDCSHFMPKNAEDFVLGKYSLCWECNDRFILNSENMKNEQPICEKCKLGIDDIDDIVSSIAKGLKV